MKYILVALLILSTSFYPNQARAEMDPKVKAMLTVAAYGTGAGALLGFASLAFGTKPRAIAMGASLGLYAGLIFGTYILVSHTYKGTIDDYEEEGTPYQAGEDAGDYYEGDDGYSGEYDEEEPLERWHPFHSSDTMTVGHSFGFKKGRSDIPPLYFNLVNIEF